MHSYGVLVLAAGEGSRMGVTKQNLQWQGRSLLRRAATAAAETVARPDDALVVLGAQAKILRSELTGLNVRVCEHGGWREGMGTSLRVGMTQLLRDGLRGVIVTLCDQPLVNSAVLRRLIDAYEKVSTELPPDRWPWAVAAAYKGTLGVPVLFAEPLFAELMAPPAAGEQQSGAKALLLRHSTRVLSIDLPEAGLDIDTPEDYKRLQEQAPP